VQDSKEVLLKRKNDIKLNIFQQKSSKRQGGAVVKQSAFKSYLHKSKSALCGIHGTVANVYNILSAISLVDEL
jgi:hypothetical protein